MSRSMSRGARWPLTLTFLGLAGCVDEPTTPAVSLPHKPNAAVGEAYVVTNTTDADIGSLRWWLSYVTGGETIRFDPSLAGQTILVDSTLRIRKGVTIEGPAGKGITISAGNKARVFNSVAQEPVTFRNVAITGGNAPQFDAGAIMALADVTLENSSVYGNKAPLTPAVYTPETLTLINSTVSGNSTTSTLAMPTLQARKKLVLINSTVAHNADVGIAVADSGIVLRNSILANNGVRNCINNILITREGVNLSDDDSCGGPTDMLIADAKLAPLANNGGPGLTHALLAGSPAINAGAACSVTVDQRYVPRGSPCDLGAFEFTTPTIVALTIDQSIAVNRGTGWAVLTGTVRCSRNETFSLALELHQVQRTGKSSTTDIHSASTVPVACTTNVQPWSTSMVLTDGAFQLGDATASAYTFNTAPWVTPGLASSAVKLYWARK